MYLSGRFAMPRRFESLKSIDCDFTVEILDSKIATGKNLSGELRAKFTTPRGQAVPPRTTIGSIAFVDPRGPVFNVKSATIQIEAGPKEGSWQTIGNFVAKGFEANGRAYLFRMVDHDETSNYIEFAVTEETSSLLKALSELAEWDAARPAA